MTYSWSRLCLNVSLYRSRKFLLMSVVSFSCRLFDSSAGNNNAISVTKKKIKHRKFDYFFFLRFISFQSFVKQKRFSRSNFKRKLYLTNITVWLPRIYGCTLSFFFRIAVIECRFWNCPKNKTFPIKIFVTTNNWYLLQC